MKIKKLIFAAVALSLCGAPRSFGQSASPAPVPPVLGVVLSRFGVTPTTVTLPAGPVILMFENRFAVRDEVATLMSKSTTPGQPGQALAALKTQGDQTRDSAVVTFTAGTFLLTFKNHPESAVEFTVTAP